VALTTDNVVGLTTAQVAALSSAQIAAMETQDLAELSTMGIQALTTSALAGLNTSQIENLKTSQVQALRLDQFESLTSTQIAAFTTAQLDAYLVTPLMLDLNGDGVRTTSVTSGVNFDADGDGKLDQVGWVSPLDGLLARDLNGDGVINDGSELFGSATKLSGGGIAGDGFQALAALDSNHDGRIDGQDQAFRELRIWVDANSDGKTDSGELKTLKDAGVQSLLLNAERTTRLDNGNLIGLVASYQTTDGRSAELADAWLQRLPINLNDASAAAMGAVLGSSSGSTNAAATTGGGKDPGGSGNAPTPPTSVTGTPAASRTPVSVAISQLADSLAGFGRDGRPLPQGLVPQQAVDLLGTVQDEERRRNMLLGSPHSAGGKTS
jgi:hypothetical protein